VHFLAGLEVRHVLLIDGDESAISRIATVPRRALPHAERAKPTQFHAVAARHRRNDFSQNGVDDLFSVAQIKVRVLCQDTLGKFGFDHVLHQSMPDVALRVVLSIRGHSLNLAQRKPLSNEGAIRLALLRLPQRIIIGFVQALNFAAVEALIPDLKPCAEGFGYA